MLSPKYFALFASCNNPSEVTGIAPAVLTVSSLSVTIASTSFNPSPTTWVKTLLTKLEAAPNAVPTNGTALASEVTAPVAPSTVAPYLEKPFSVLNSAPANVPKTLDPFSKAVLKLFTVLTEPPRALFQRSADSVVFSEALFTASSYLLVARILDPKLLLSPE